MAVTETIQQILQGIDSAQYGRDMREFIHKGIEKCYEEGSAGETDLVAREALDNIGLMSSYEFAPTNKTGTQASDDFPLTAGKYLAVLNGTINGVQNVKTDSAEFNYKKGSSYLSATPYIHFLDFSFDNGAFFTVIPFEVVDSSGYFNVKIRFKSENTYYTTRISVILVQIK